MKVIGLLPAELRTPRLWLRAWRARDAALLAPVLAANREHLAGWIPAHVAAPAELPELERRLAGFADDFAAGRSCRFGIFLPGEAEVLGEASLFFRTSAGRVPLVEADRAEVGYWLRRDATGQGYASEAAKALISLAAHIPVIRHVEIRCDAHNTASAAVPRRLGFQLATDDVGDGASMVWVGALRPPRPPAEGNGS